MSNSQREIKFPAKKPMKEMGRLLDESTLNNIRVTDKKGATMFEAPLRLNIGGKTLRCFKAPFKAFGVGISTIAKLIGVQVAIDSTTENEEAHR